MDHDRKSVVSSFYGGRRSTDALNADYASPPTNQNHARIDSASSFYNPDRASRAGTGMHGATPTAGYNRSSFFLTGREEPVKGGYDEESMMANRDEGFDIYADFNNQGPRYSAAFVHKDTGYRPVPSPTPYKEQEANPATPGSVELVTVPALGPEWKKSEMREMRSSAKRQEALESFRDKWNAWNRGERGICGPYFTRRTTTYVVFGLCVAVGIVLAFVIPRVPDLYFPSSNPLSNATYPFNSSVQTIFSRSPANFSFPADVSIQFSTSSNYLPLHFTKLEATVFDQSQDRQVATGHLGSTSIPAKAYSTLKIPLNFTYVATNDSDITWLDFYDACRNPAANANDTRPPLQFYLDLDMYILGLPGKKSESITATEAECPITLSLSAA
ncbi:uncharacterized protein LAESUDRAFT_720163 [Laetiporus sulphureus 93-53]|uniref:Uncharacterized protein n=1 Tax=Laetiporus sulphureus 93-53 TaxID=1314785 RepID=A0A165HU51_9APHY|nr:uncharacterized protein LAESUDRAFT_720163 [Laetiporus sulphureus 93-53]KZT12189.1 hypothetical protein LAESUDRAFT_720163 [Laetiporus sulphureus 93-53]